MHGFYRVAVTAPRLRVADVDANVREIIVAALSAERETAQVVVYPELAITGYTCADLFFQDRLLTAARDGLKTIATATAGGSAVHIVGAPLLLGSRLYNCAVVIQGGVIYGIVPKINLPTYREYYEGRWFTTGLNVQAGTVEMFGKAVPFGTDLIFRVDENLQIGIEICEDLWSVTPPSGPLALAGATLLVNLSASNELVAKADYRRQLVAGQSARCVAAYAYASAGVGESTTDLVFGGHLLIAENGIVIAENQRFQVETQTICTDIDCQRLRHARISETSFGLHPPPTVRILQMAPVPTLPGITRVYPRHPFVPGNAETRAERCHEIIDIQTVGLLRRLTHAGNARPVIGISGGLDSTLALLVAHRVCCRMGWPSERMLTVTMPGFGTTARTRDNAISLCRLLSADLRTIDITPACRQHFADIGHDPNDHTVTYENVQARERTQILMDLANSEGGIVVGTGDLSEVALGWSTYNGDHMSMYAVNIGIPKTLVQYLIRWFADNADDAIRAVLLDILATPISPELTPTGPEGQLLQHTEDIVGPYELHDYFLYHAVKYGAAPKKILELAAISFAGSYEVPEIKKWLNLFFRRFFTQQFKRSCMPDGPKVGTICLSPRGDWRMPSDAISTLWQV